MKLTPSADGHNDNREPGLREMIAAIIDADALEPIDTHRLAGRIASRVAAYVAGLEAEVAKLREVVEEMANQFAYACVNDGRLVLSTGGLSALENAFDALGWPDPKPCPERKCQTVDCHREATTGTQTADGYKRLCFEHYRELGTPVVALACPGAEP